ncbi:hypothetical protein ACHHYP_05151 [Achlya hypogyna]|uniref:Uncharacterized protein n=1 Tax=Achlya hypogyna TaxID=1202772 RepID=A0A1V9YZD9_ACHHY|nr:hypothetical protein ACHHYP_05151 [Achlya hypogyna]
MCYTSQATGHAGADLSFDALLDANDYAQLVECMRAAPDDTPLVVAAFITIQRSVDTKEGEQHAKSLGSVGACDVVAQILRALSTQEEVQFYGCQAVRALAVAPRNVFRFEALRVLDHLHELLIAFPATSRVVTEVLWTIDILITASEPLTLRFFRSLDGVPLLLSVLSQYQEEPLAQWHGCRVLAAIARRFKRAFTAEYLQSTGNCVLTAVVTHVPSMDVVMAGVVFVELVCDADVDLFFGDGAWFRTLFAAHLKHAPVVAELVHLYRTLCHASPAHALQVAAQGAWHCVERALGVYLHDEPIAFDLLRLVHHIVARITPTERATVEVLGGNSSTITALVLDCHRNYEDHVELQIEVACIVGHLASFPTPNSEALTQAAGSLRHVMALNPASATLQREGRHTLEKLGHLQS